MTQMIEFNSRDKLVQLAVDWEGLSEVSRMALGKLGLAQIGANRIPARVSAWKKEHDGYNDDDIATLTQNLVADYLAAIHDGTIGVRTAREVEEVDPLAKEMRELAEADVLEVFNKNKVPYVKGRRENGKLIPGVYKLAGGDMTKTEAVNRWLTNYADNPTPNGKEPLRVRAAAIVRLRERQGSKADNSVAVDELFALQQAAE